MSSSDSDLENTSMENYLKEKLDLLEKYEVDTDEELEAEEEIDPVKEFAEIPGSIDLQLQLKPLGHVYAALAPFIIVQPLSSAAVIDVGSTVVDSESRNVVGLVWDVFGPVKSPLYSVLWRPDCQEPTVGSTLHFSPELVNIVSRDMLAADKGIDADPSMPPEFSDDEQELDHRKGRESGEI